MILGHGGPSVRPSLRPSFAVCEVHASYGDRPCSSRNCIRTALQWQSNRRWKEILRVLAAKSLLFWSAREVMSLTWLAGYYSWLNLKVLISRLAQKIGLEIRTFKTVSVLKVLISRLIFHFLTVRHLQFLRIFDRK